MDDVPGREEIADWLGRERGRPAGQAAEWSRFLAGLPWRYVRPVVQIAVNSRTHPAVALATAARYSKDAAFVAAASRHLQDAA